MHSSEFDGAAAFSGGGFMPSQPLRLRLVGSIENEGLGLQATLVGRVCNKAGRITDVTFVLDDGAGKIGCSKWLQEDVDTNEAEGLRSLNDFNEIASPFVDCIYVHLYNTRVQFSGQHINGQKSVEDRVLDILHLPSNRAKEEGVSRDLMCRASWTSSG
ncbi:replication protein A 32 kDa subunit B-like [Neltuma alba]|uniref:replication protein A 32 kDa subunit B-like n=1 Tax=Neltuma alba TaxID=207710 RepID=UPI0010A466E1|nr:replication protein A 32 kDa subunit B-like [Prosopis alba]